ncbi:hypothetical protein [uncultured Arthrobacter sp.]|uniref:hypothetical protein n=1 Tax=uncultured Arthrobacter sp. TaxID=114050 RepID=UPI0028D0EEAF|nr:hypothetical protein [uncultured Arthrobacter sp.]
MTEKTEASYLLEIRGDKAQQIREDLNGAVERAIGHAKKVGRHGVLVTQHSYTFYTVTLSNDVPYGQIQERRLTEPVDAALNQSGSFNLKPPQDVGRRTRQRQSTEIAASGTSSRGREAQTLGGTCLLYPHSPSA